MIRIGPFEAASANLDGNSLCCGVPSPLAALGNWRREAGQGMRAADTGAKINAAIDHGNYLAYGLAGVVLWSLGVPASLAALHGKTRAGGLVFDLADTLKDPFVLPIA